MTVAVFRVVPEFVLPRSEEALKDVVKLEPDSFLVHYSLPLSAPYTMLSDKQLNRDATDDEIIAHCGLYVLLPSFEGELRMKGGGGLRKWNTRFFLLRHEQLMIFKHRGDKKPQSSTSVLDARSVRRASPNDCSDRRRHGCAVLLDSVHGSLVIEAATTTEGDRMLALLSKWIDMAPFCRNPFRFDASKPVVPANGGGTVILDPLVRAISSPRGLSVQAQLSSTQQATPAQQPANAFFDDDDDDADATTPLADDLSAADAQLANASGSATLVLSDASAMMASRSGSISNKPKTTMRNIEIENDQTVAITLSDDAPVHTLVPIIAKQVKNDITPLTDADTDPSSPIIMLDHYLSLGAHQLPFDASLLLKDSGGARPGVREENRYATLGTFVLVFARLPAMCDRVAVRKGVSKKRLWLELSGMYLRCYQDTSPAAMDEMSTLRKFAQQAADDLQPDPEDSIDKVEYLDGSQLASDDNGTDELDEIARVEKELVAMRAKAAAGTGGGADDRGELVGQLHVSHIEFVSTDVKNSKSFKVMFRRPPLSQGLLPAQQLAPATSATDLSYTFVCDDVEVKLDWYELLNDWLPFFQSYRDADGFLQSRDNSRAMRGLLGEEIYTTEETLAYNQKLAAATQNRALTDDGADAANNEDYGASGRKPITRTAAPLSATRTAPSPEMQQRASPVLQPPVAAGRAAAPVAAASAPAISLPPRPVARGQSPVLPAARGAPASPVQRRPPAAAPPRGPPAAVAGTPPRSGVASNYVTVDPGPDPALPPLGPPPVISPRLGTSPPTSQPPMPPVQQQAAAPQPSAPARRGPQVTVPPVRVGGAPSPKLPPIRASPAPASPSRSVPVLAQYQVAPPQQYETVPEMPATPTNRSAYRIGKPKFNRPPGDGTHDDPQRQQRFMAMVKQHLTKYAWYGPSYTRQTAEAKLKGQPEKSFVVRDSSVPHCLALSHVSGGKVVHVVLEFWDCDEVRGWTKEDGKTISASVAQLLGTFDFVDLTPYTVK
jgi:hypothetical protein